jgi:hypothetical protein
MSRKTIKFELAHKDFKTTQMSAFHSYEMLFGKEEWAPEGILSDTYVREGSDWARLDSNEEISRLIFHPLGLESPLSVLMRLIEKVKGISCSAMYRWESVKIPKRFLSSASTVESPRGMPILSTLFTEKLATLHALQEFYSLDDALRMYDDYTVQNINKALQNEKAMAEAKRR